MKMQEVGTIIFTSLAVAEKNLRDLLESTEAIKEMKNILSHMTEKEQDEFLLDPSKVKKVEQALEYAFGNPSEDKFIEAISSSAELISVDNALNEMMHNFTKEKRIPNPKAIARLSKSFVTYIEILNDFYDKTLGDNKINAIKEEFLKMLIVTTIEL